MRVLCAIGRRGGAELARRTLELAGANLELTLLYVIDSGPRRDLDQWTGPLRRGPLGGPARTRAIEAAEDASSDEILTEAEAAAQEAGVSATRRVERGKAEQVIVAVAREIGAELVAIRARERPEEHPLQGPPSIGHTARFVVDHAPCDVLLVRSARA